MKAIILHESKGRIRFRIGQKKMTLQEADVLENWFQKKSWITQVTVHERTGCWRLSVSLTCRKRNHKSLCHCTAAVN